MPKLVRVWLTMWGVLICVVVVLAIFATTKDYRLKLGPLTWEPVRAASK